MSSSTQQQPLAASTAASPQEDASPEEAAIASAMAQDRPVIDSAVKSFMSLICARSLTTSDTDNTDGRKMDIAAAATPTSTTAVPSNVDTNKLVLQLARAILQSVNSYTFPIHCTVAHVKVDKPNLSQEQKQQYIEVSVVSRLWNGLVESKQKPSKFLGQRALRHAWAVKELNETIRAKIVEPNNDADGADEKSNADAIRDLQFQWLQEFERLLFFVEDPNNANEDNDAALIWSPDGGEAELAKRRQRRQAGATERGPVTPS